MASMIDRIRSLVAQHRSVNAAARAWGISQRSLARLLDGGTSRPRVDLIQQIAKSTGVRLEWLLTGEGAMLAGEGAFEPRGATESAAMADLNAVFAELGLTDDIRMPYVQSAWTIAVATRVLLAGVILRTAAEGKRFPIEEVLEHQERAWATTLRWMVDTLGTREASRRLIKVAPYAHRFYDSYAERWSMAGQDIIRDAQMYPPPFPEISEHKGLISPRRKKAARKARRRE